MVSAVSNIRVILGISDDALKFEAHTGSLTKLPTPPRERRSPVTDPQPSLNRAPRPRPISSSMAIAKSAAAGEFPAVAAVHASTIPSAANSRLQVAPVISLNLTLSVAR